MLKCQAWCNESLLTPQLLYHTWAEKCEWKECSQCSSCGNKRDEDRSTLKSKVAWTRQNAKGSPINNNFPVHRRIDHHGCHNLCAAMPQCTMATWNCNAKCYLRENATFFDEREEECTYSWSKHASVSTPCKFYAPLYNSRRLVHSTRGMTSPPTVCCNFTPRAAPVPRVVPITSNKYDMNVLLIMSVGRSHAENIKHTCGVTSRLQRLTHHCVHYDDAGAWFQAHGWFRRCCRTTDNIRLRVKTRIIVKTLLRRRLEWATQYSHLWFVDEDVVFPSSPHVRRFLARVQRYAPLIVQPTVDGSTWDFLLPTRDCVVRSTDFVEIMLPMMAFDVAVDIFLHYFPNMTTDWGMDVTWCSYAAKRFNQFPTCAIVGGGVFRHPAKRSPLSAYSRTAALNDESCMRHHYKNLVSSFDTPACLEQDEYGTISTHIYERTATRESTPLMYVYNLSGVPGNGYCVPGGNNNFAWERHVEANLRQVFRTTMDAARADFFLVPACLTSYWAQGWEWDAAASKLSSCINCTDTAERKILEVMERVGDWFHRYPDRHLVYRHRCPFLRDDDWKIGAGDRVYGTLWFNSQVRYVCLETDNDHRYVPDLDRQVHIPYYVPTTAIPLAKKNRVRSLGFIGTFCCGRGWVQHVLKSQDYMTLRSHVSHDLNASSVAEFARSSYFMLQPAGDTPERRGIYESVSLGTPVILTSFVAPPLRLPDWQSVAIESWSGRLPASPVINTRRLLRLIRNYDSFMSDFAQRREILLWGTRPFLQRLAAVVTDVFAS